MDNCNNIPKFIIPEITIALINWNVTDKLRLCMDSIIRTCNNINFEAYIIDNNSQDEDFDNIINEYSMYRQFVFIRNFTNEAILAFNRIKSKINGRYLLILGPDTILKENCIKELILFMDVRPDAGAATGKLLNPDGSPQIYYYKLWTVSMVFYSTLIGRAIDHFLLSDKMDYYYHNKRINTNSINEVEQPAGACFIVRKNLLLEDGFIIDNNFPFYYNDVDICKRIYDKGFKIYLVPSAEAYHDHSSSFKKIDPLWKITESSRSQIIYFRKYYKNIVWLVKFILLQDVFVSIIANRILFFKKRGDTGLKGNFKNTISLIKNIIEC